MDDYSIDNTYTDDPKLDQLYKHEGNSSGRVGEQEVESTMEVLTRVELDLAYSSEKLVNLHVLLMHLLAWDNDLDVMAMENGYISAASIEKAFIFDLQCGILESEVREVENFMDNVRAWLGDTRHKISSYRHSTELFTVMEGKLRNSEELLKKSRDHVLEVKMQLAKFQIAFSAFRLENWKDDNAVELSANNQPSNINANSKRLTSEKQKHILRMLENSLAKEQDLEKQMSELRRNEVSLKLKLHHTEQVALRMEETAEVVWGRFLEAENAAEVLMGISKELVGQLQIVQFNLNGSFQREAELKSKLQECIQQLDGKDTALKKLETSIAEHIAISSEVPILTEKVKLLEEQLKKSEMRLKNANAFNEEIQEQLSEVENIVESLKESVYEAESRAETAEAKVTQLTDTNLELTEEINFLKGGRDSNTKKVSLIEKQVRELEIQLQHAKSSSEASQEQQNMLYSAIWDMETLIEDLKSKVSKAESKTESAEEQCIILSESNLELNKELSFLRSRVKSLETSLDQANKSKATSAKEINLRNRLIMDTVMQLASERERIQNQLLSFTKENVPLVEKLRNAKRDASLTMCNNANGDDKKLLALIDDSSNDTCGKPSEETVTSCKSSEVDQSEIEGGTSHSMHDGADMVSKLGEERTERAGRLNLMNVKAFLVALIAGTVIYLFHKIPVFIDKF